MLLVGLVELLQEDQGQHCVGTQAEVVGSEAFPQREKSLKIKNICQILLSENYLSLFLN